MLKFLFFLFFCASVHGFMDNLADKVIKPQKDVDQKCADILTNTSLSQMERCEFFKCFEDRFPCGKQYWIMNWGYKYCRRYADSKFIEKFTPTGKKLLEHVNKCLPKQFEKNYKSKRPIRCKKLNNEAFSAQTKCYTDIQKDFCTGFVENKMLFVQVLDNSDLINMESISMIKKASEKCTPKIDLLGLMSG